MIAPLPLLLLALLAPPPELTLEPVQASWERATKEVFDTRWLVGRASAAELEASPRGTIDLVDALQELLDRRFEPAEGADALARARSVGDLVALFAGVREDQRAVDALLRRLRAERPEMWKAVAWALPELVREKRFLSTRWDPDDDRDDDGFLFAPPRDLALVPGGPWKRAEGSTLAIQAATLIHADLLAIKSAENDFRTWPERVGASYDSIAPVPGSYLRGKDPRDEPFAALRVRFRCDLPFPFGHYDCDLRMLHRLDERGRLLSDVESSSEDFYWLAGQDVFLPVLDSEGEWVSLLCVRVFGCDLRGVPDSRAHHEAGARQGVGNMKRDAERLWRARTDGRAPVYEGAVPEFEVHGA